MGVFFFNKKRREESNKHLSIVCNLKGKFGINHFEILCSNYFSALQYLLSYVCLKFDLLIIKIKTLELSTNKEP